MRRITASAALLALQHCRPMGGGALGGDGSGGAPQKISIKRVSIPQRPDEDDDDVPTSVPSSSFVPPAAEDDVVQRHREIKNNDVHMSDPLDAAMSNVRRQREAAEGFDSQTGEVDTDTLMPQKGPKKGRAQPRRKKTMDDVLGDVLTEAIAMKDQGQKPDVDTIYKKTQERLYEAEHGRKAPSGNTQEIQKKYLPFPPVMSMYRLEPMVYLVSEDDVQNKEDRRAGRKPPMRRYVSPSAESAASPSPSPPSSGFGGGGSLINMNFGGSKTGEEYMRELDASTQQINADVFAQEAERTSRQLEDYMQAHEDPWPIRGITHDNPILNRHDADQREAARVHSRNDVQRRIKSLEAELIRLCQPNAAPNVDGKSVAALEAEVQGLNDDLATNPAYLDDHARMYAPRAGFNPVEEFSDAVDEHFYWEQQFIRFIRDVPLWQRRSLPYLHEHYRLVTHRLVRSEARFIACRDKALASVKAGPKLFAETEERIDRSRMLCADTHKSLSSPNYDPLRMKKKSLAGTLMGMTEAQFDEWNDEQRAIKNTLIATLAPDE